jgi:hypothetical protein
MKVLRAVGDEAVGVGQRIADRVRGDRDGGGS